MKLLSIIVCAALCLSCSVVSADTRDQQQVEREVAAFFDSYLDVYNRRFGRPDRSAAFRRDLAALVHTPLLQSPVMGKPMVPASMEVFTRNFEGFVTMLEGKGVNRLVWEQREFELLSPNKVLANNVGIGLTEDGEQAYETVSLYLLYRTDAGWKIALFSPYDRANTLRLSRE